jgi:hypothetical protein
MLLRFFPYLRRQHTCKQQVIQLASRNGILVNVPRELQYMFSTKVLDPCMQM